MAQSPASRHPSVAAAAGCPSPAHRLVPFMYVADVEATLAFYALLGFECRSILRDKDGCANWAWAETTSAALHRGRAQVMFSRTGRPIVPGNQDIFFYLHSLNLKFLREHLLASGVKDGGAATVWEVPGGVERARRTLFGIQYPVYMPGGEFRVHDPDGYCVLIGQLDEPVHGDAS